MPLHDPIVIGGGFQNCEIFLGLCMAELIASGRTPTA